MSHPLSHLFLHLYFTQHLHFLPVVNHKTPIVAKWIMKLTTFSCFQRVSLSNDNSALNGTTNLSQSFLGLWRNIWDCISRLMLNINTQTEICDYISQVYIIGMESSKMYYMFCYISHSKSTSHILFHKPFFKTLPDSKHAIVCFYEFQKS